MFRHGWKLVALIIVAAFIFLWLIKAPIMSSYITRKMGVPVTLRTISMWPKVTIIRRFRIENPHGFQTRSAFEAKKTVIKYRFGNLTGVPSEIDLIVLEDVYLNIEVRNRETTDNNWAAIGAQSLPRRGGREVIVHKLIIRNMTVETQGKGAKALGVSGTRHFDEMEFNEINSRDGFPTKELVSRIFQDVGLMQYIQNFLRPTERIKDAIQKPFNIFGKQKTPD